MQTIGFIGCGRMGMCMLKGVLDNNYSAVVYDKFEGAKEAAKKLGAQVANTPADVAQNAEVILMSLPGPQQLFEVMNGEGGIKEYLTEKHIVVDTSTVEPQTTREMYKHAKEKGAEYLDCPILGRPSAAGKWLLPTGGSKEALEKVKPILLTFSQDAIHVGDSGAGNALKLINQLMFSSINAISAEAMAISEHVGIKKEVFYDVVASSSAATVSGLFREVGKCIVNDGYESPAFTVDLLLKDTKLAMKMASESNAPSVIAGTAQMYNEIAHAQGMGGDDTAALFKTFEQHYSNINN